MFRGIIVYQFKSFEYVDEVNIWFAVIYKAEFFQKITSKGKTKTGNLFADFLRNIGITRTNLFSALIPVVSAVAAAILGADIMTNLRYCGIAIVILGVIIAQRD